MKEIANTTRDLFFDVLKRKGYDIQELETGICHTIHRDNNVEFYINERAGRVTLVDAEWCEADANDADEVAYVKEHINVFNNIGNWKLIIKEYKDVVTVSSHVTFHVNEEISNLDDYVLNQLDVLLNLHCAFFRGAGNLPFTMPAPAPYNVPSKVHDIITYVGKITDSSEKEQENVQEEMDEDVVEEDEMYTNIDFRYEGADMKIIVSDNRPFVELVYKELYVISADDIDMHKDAMEIVEEINRSFYITTLYYEKDEHQDLVISIHDWLFIGSDIELAESALFDLLNHFFNVKRRFEKEMLRRSISDTQPLRHS